MKRNFPLHIHISTLFLLLILIVGGLIGGISFKLSREMLEATADDLTERINRETLADMKHLLAPAEMAVKLLAHDVLSEAGTLEQRLARLPLLRDTLDSSAALSSLYLGYETGDFFFIRRVFDADERQFFGAPADTRYIVQSIERAVHRGRYLFLDAGLGILRSDERPDYPDNFDPRQRTWYGQAQTSKTQIQTAPYLFFSNRKVGSTLAKPAANGRAVVGADILLATLGNSLARQKITPGSQLALIDARGQVIAHEDVARLVSIGDTADAKPRLQHIDTLGIPAFAGVGGRLAGMQEPRAHTWRSSLADGDWRLGIHPLNLEGAATLHLVMAIPERELLASAMQLRSASLLITVFIVLLSVPIAWIVARAISGPLRSLVRAAEAIRRFEFSKPVQVNSLVREVNDLALTMEGMQSTIRRFLDISQAVAAEPRFERLLPRLLEETLNAASAELAILYLADSDGLLPVAALRKDANAPMDLIGSFLPMPIDGVGPLLSCAIAAGSPCGSRLSASDIDCIGLAETLPDAEHRHGLAVPLQNRQGTLVGAMLLVRRERIEEALISFVRALAASAATSLETRELIKAQKELFEAFIQLIAGAIDAKSPYTGGHCARVPELIKLLAQAACDESSGPYADFQLDDDQWEAVRVAAWLHDCGKVTTPEFVIDKATKLETIYDRIHEIRMRFEVMKRDAEIRSLQAMLDGADAAACRRKLASELQQIDADFAFVATCNEGGEFMAPEKIERLRGIAGKTWLRTLDDRIGISHEELERKAGCAPGQLPVVENLLSDKPEHRFTRRPQDCISDQNPWGFRMPVPELLYNRGELHNLAVARGTLSDEERYKINEHIVQTLIMLGQLPFPKHLRQVPEIAGGHHEKMDGTGYPRRLTREQMSPLARMMAIVDIFEALTATDRPYKKGKTLSEAIKIMASMKQEQHIDGELFDLFLRAGVYREYAERFMRAEQIDTVDITKYLSS